MTVNTYDSKCYELADYFLPEAAYAAHLRHSLALAIQDAIEDWFWELDLSEVEKLVATATKETT